MIRPAAPLGTYETRTISFLGLVPAAGATLKRYGIRRDGAPPAPAAVAVCVWELAVLQHERAAWLRHVLTPDGRSDAGACLADVMPGDV